MRRILVTGGQGFVGRHLVPRLSADGHAVTVASRSAADGASIAVGDIGPDTDWAAALSGCDTVVHLAAQTSSDKGGERCIRVNDKGTQRLVETALVNGVQTFVMLSTVMALVDNVSESVVSDDTPSRAQSSYGVSKLRAEAHVSTFAAAGRCGISLRAPVIYGPDARGNMSRLKALAATPIPLPLGAVRNRRSMISVTNLVDAVATVLAASPSCPSGTFLVSDEESVSTADLLRYLRTGQGRPARLVPVPAALMSTPLRIAGLNGIADSLFGDLVVDSSRFRRTFGWSPPEDAATAIKRSA